jgi:hypothetical protein
MKQPIAGLTPSELQEATVAVVWPTIGATAAGRLVGRVAGVRPAWDRFLIVGKLAAAATIPISLAAFVWQLLPYVCRRYRLTNRRIVVQKGLSPVEERQIGLDAFDTIEISLQPGQEWLRSGDLVFQRGGSEVFRLEGVSRPDVFRAACLKVRAAMLAVRNALSQQAVAR